MVDYNIKISFTFPSISKCVGPEISRSLGSTVLIISTNYGSYVEVLSIITTVVPETGPWD